MPESLRMFYFVLYTLIWESIVWFGTMYLVYWMNASAWLIVLAVIISASQFPPRKFGIKSIQKRPEEMDKDQFKQYMEAKRLD